MICEIYCTFLNILCNSACFNKKLRRKPQFFFTPVYSSTVFVVIVVTGLPCLSGAVLYVAVVEIVRQALHELRQNALTINAASKANRQSQLWVVRRNFAQSGLACAAFRAFRAVRLCDLDVCFFIVCLV